MENFYFVIFKKKFNFGGISRLFGKYFSSFWKLIIYALTPYHVLGGLKSDSCEISFYLAKEIVKITTSVTHVENHLLNQGYWIDTFFQCQKDHKCNACEKDFSLWIFYLVFVEVHHGQKDHNCDSCGISFAQPHNRINGELSVILILPP